MFKRRFKALLLLYLRRCVEDLALQLGLLESPLDSSPALRDLRALSLFSTCIQEATIVSCPSVNKDLVTNHIT